MIPNVISLGLTRLILFVIARSRYSGRRGNPDTQSRYRSLTNFICHLEGVLD